MASSSLSQSPPVLPPVPAGPEPYFRARGLAALIAAIDDAVINHHGPGGDAVVVVVGGRVIDAIAESPQGSSLVGLEALNAIDTVEGAGLRATTLDRRLALVLPTYWREPDRLPSISGRWVDLRGVTEAVMRRSRRGVVVLTSRFDTGVVFFDEEGLVAAYSQRHPEPGPLDLLDELLMEPDTVLRARVTETATPAVRHMEAPHHRIRPEDHEREEPVAALPDPVERCRAQIMDMAESILHLHAEPVVARFRNAPATTSGLMTAADEIRRLRLRLVSPATMGRIADRAEEIVRSISRRA
ncbi:MAG TPA: hypothetical protein VKY90_06135 [Candidatus Dormibacteraeota bacterium]|nr:hypothetical protein [Candidatus Dormibacteraeota bacterium]